ncbi:DinB family protein [Bacillus sp. FJAT-29937]|uniref:DinB family protein n=1 Tax=Bacillus sp. FJAT-29937 TaxID=1720553 RepID=UPI00082C9D49|nr:DinB family protein [Bacillus sp. FJAT-29937]
MNEKKRQICSHYETTIDRVKKYYSLSEDKWRMPIEEGKWTIAEVIGHLIPWDEFILKQRIPYFFQDNQLPKGPDAEIVNNQAAAKSRERSKEETINKFISVREDLIGALKNFEDSLWEQEFTIGDSKLSLYSYFSGMAKHDIHHFEQIERIV